MADLVTAAAINGFLGKKITDTTNNILAEIAAQPTDVLENVYVNDDFSIDSGKRYFVDTTEQEITGTLDGNYEDLKNFEIVDINNKFHINSFYLDTNNERIDLKKYSNPIEFDIKRTKLAYRFIETSKRAVNVVRTSFNINSVGNQSVQFNIGNKGSTWTLMGWFKIPASGSQIRVATIGGGETNGASFAGICISSDGNLQLASGNDSSQSSEHDFDTAIDYDTDTEYFIALRKNANNSFDCYVNGTKKGSTIDPTYEGTASAWLKLATHGGNYYDVKIRQVSVWDSAINQAGIQEAYNSGVPGYNLQSHTNAANLDHWWAMDTDDYTADDGVVFEDKIGSADGTYVNADSTTFDIVSTTYESVSNFSTLDIGVKPIADKSRYTPFYKKADIYSSSLTTTTVANLNGEGTLETVILLWNNPGTSGSLEITNLKVTVDGTLYDYGDYNGYGNSSNGYQVGSVTIPININFNSSLLVEATTAGGSNKNGVHIKAIGKYIDINNDI